MEKITQNLIGKLSERQFIPKEKKKQYVYALECLMEYVFTLSSIVVIAYILNALIEMMSFLFAFLILRRRTGGYHLKSYWQCYIGTIFMCILVKDISDCFIRQEILEWCIYLAAFVAIFLIGSVNHPNMDWTMDEFLWSKKEARKIVIIETLFIVVANICNVNRRILAYAMTGVIVCSFLLALAKITGQEVKKT